MGRLASLDALRGAAAFAVVVQHCLLSFSTFYSNWEMPAANAIPSPLTWRAIHSPLHLLFCGDEAVLLFFVLSGYVLSLQFLADRPRPPTVKYLVKRFVRLYLPYAAAVALACVLMTFGRRFEKPALSDFFFFSWSAPVSLALLRDKALLIGAEEHNHLNLVTWTLVYEMRISLVLPALAWFVRRVRTGWVLVIALAVWGGAVVAMRVTQTSVYGGSLLATASVAPLFVIGAVLAKERQGLHAAFERGGRALPPIALALALWLFIFKWMPNGDRLADDWQTFPSTIGAAALIVCALEVGSLARVFTSDPLRWLGKVSYSLYLIHLPTLLTLAYVGHRWVPVTWLVLAAIPLSLPVAAVFHRLVEVPSQRLGRRLAGA
jgi:peptidoglycan/LPS O-acetylase OafA/YrhL